MKPLRGAADSGDFTIDYVEMYVGDLDVTALNWVGEYAFKVIGTGDSEDHRSVALRHGRITLLLTEALSDQHPASEFVLAHGDGVANIALRTSDVRRTFDIAIANGASPVQEPTARGSTGPAVTAAISTFGDVVHTLVRHPAAESALPAGFVPVPGAQARESNAVGLLDIDHFAVCVNTGDLGPTVDFYQRALGFGYIFEEKIIVGTQAMNSQVVQSLSGSVTFTILEPDPQADPGQIDEYIKNHQAAGIQHIAFSTDDAVRCVRALASRGISFLTTPRAYYDLLGARIDPEGHTLDELRETNLLADQDQAGQMFQIFTKSTHPRQTLFFEIIERKGAKTFGNANIKALYEAVELERMRQHEPRR